MRSSVDGRAGQASPQLVRPLHARLFIPLLAGLTACLIATVVLAISIGSVHLPLRTVWLTELHHLAPGLHLPPVAPVDDAIIWNFRTPRALLAVVVGSGLAVAGAALQALVRNPLADPYVLGIVQGSSLGAVLVISIGTAAAGKAVLTLAAFAGGLLCLLLVLLFGRSGGRVTSTRLVLSGVALGYVFQAATDFVQLSFSSGEGLAGVVFWLLGTFAAASWSDLGVPSLVVVVSIGLLMLHVRSLNALAMGDDTAVALGIPVSRMRVLLTVVASVLTAAAVAVAGGVGFVGLLVPHMARLLVGADHRRVIPTTAVIGGLFMVLADLVARTVASPLELPLNVVTAAVGGPFFLWLMRRRSAGASGAV